MTDDEGRGAVLSPSLAAAYKYASWGWALLPVHYPMDGGCSCGSTHADRPREIGKHPALLDGFHGASSAIEDVERWWLDQEWNIGVRTGAASGIMVVDVDGPDGVAELEQLEAEHGSLPPTFTYRSGRDDVSTHRVFTIPEGRVVRTTKLAPHIDVKAEGGYALLPPSLHRTGRHYGAR